MLTLTLTLALMSTYSSISILDSYTLAYTNQHHLLKAVDCLICLQSSRLDTPLGKIEYFPQLSKLGRELLYPLSPRTPLSFIPQYKLYLDIYNIYILVMIPPFPPLKSPIYRKSSRSRRCYRIVQIRLRLPYLQKPGLQIWLRLQKVQSCTLQIVGHLPLPDIYPINILGNFTQVSLQWL